MEEVDRVRTPTEPRERTEREDARERTAGATTRPAMRSAMLSVEGEEPPVEHPRLTSEDGAPDDDDGDEQTDERRDVRAGRGARAPRRGSSQNSRIAVRQPASNASARVSEPK